jgi:PAS domain S-box-containing protein
MHAAFLLRLVLSVVLLNLSLFCLVGLSLAQSYRQYEGRAGVFAGDLAQLLQQNIGDTIDKIDLALLATRDEVERQLAAGEIDEAGLNGFLRRQTERIPAIDGLHLANAEGEVVYGEEASAENRRSITDRPYYAELRDNPSAGLLISRPVLGVYTGKPVLILARRYNRPDGGFGGVIIVSVTVDHFAELFASLDLGAKGVAVLRDRDLGMLARYPQMPPGEQDMAVARASDDLRAAVAKAPEGGLYRTQGAFDHIDRTFAYRQIPHRTLWVILGVATEDYLTGWRQDAVRQLSLALLFTVISAMAAVLLLKVWRVRDRALHETEVASARLAAILDNTPVGLAIIGTDRVIQTTNKALGEIFGVNGAALVGQGMRPLYPSLAAFEEMGPRIYGILRADQAFRDDVPLVRHDGSDFWCRVQGRMVDPADPSLGAAWVFEDITERKHKEQELALYRSLVEHTSDCVYALSPSEGFRMVFANEATCRHFGVPRETLMTWRLADWSPDYADPAAVRGLWAEVKAHQAPLLQMTHRLAGGQTVSVELSANYLVHDGEEFLAGSFRDVSERLAAEQALRDKTEELARSNAELEQFAYVASHDLREPLRMVSAYVGLIDRRYGDKIGEEGREFIAFAKDGAERMDRLILDLLEYSRIGRAMRPLEMLPLAEVVDEAVANLQGSIEDSSAVVTIGSGLPSLFGDRNELVRLFQNLIGNAIKYHDAERPPVVVVEARAVADEWEIAVHDNGIGISSADFERIFGIFQRLHARDAYEGTGIGLAVCRKVVAHHKGRIKVESILGKGSTFRIVLPAQSPCPALLPSG